MSGASERAYEQIRTLLIQEQYAPGSRLSESELSQKCGVSRTPVREALRRLALEYFVRIEPNRGAFVIDWSREDIIDMFEMRSMMEGLAARKAAERATPKQILGLSKIVIDIEEIELLKNERIKFSAEDLTELRSVKDIYLIARIVVYQDPLFAKIFPDEAVYDSRLDKPYSQDGQYFLDPSSIKVQNYIKNIALQACELGFDEIQYDYIRYPDSNSKFMIFDHENTTENRVKNINSFLKDSKDILHAEKCLLSADTFGFILTNNKDGGIGQNLESIVNNVDFISPMVYPSHYSKGSFGYQYPNNFPYEVVSAALNDGIKRGIEKEKIRPFLQGFWHDAKDVQLNIKAAEDKNLDWIIWNNSSQYELEYFTKIES